MCCALYGGAIMLGALLATGCGSHEAQGVVRTSSDVTGSVRDVKSRLVESAPKVTVTVRYHEPFGQAAPGDTCERRFESGPPLRQNM